MTVTTLDCEWSDCTWESKEASIEICLRLLEFHVAANHPSTAQPRSSMATAKPEKAKRPELASEMSDKNWAYFVSRWEDYKKATALQGEEVVIQLMECCCEQLRRDHHRTYPKTGVGTVTESTRLAELKQLAVRQKNRMVNRVKLGTLKQDKGEPVRKYAGRIRSLASVSEYNVSCSTCKASIPYTEPVILDQVIAGLADVEIQKDVLSHPDAANMNLEKLLQFVEGKESGQASQGLMTGNLVGEVDRKAKCSYCDSQHVKGKQHCKAAGKKCEQCGKYDHLAKVCRSKPSTSAEHVKKEGVKETKQKAKAAWAYPEGNWACNVDTTPKTDAYTNSYQEEGFNSYPEDHHVLNTFENKSFESYESDYISLYDQAGLYGDLKEVIKAHDKKEGSPTLDTISNEVIKNKNPRNKKVGHPPLSESQKRQ